MAVGGAAPVRARDEDRSRFEDRRSETERVDDLRKQEAVKAALPGVDGAATPRAVEAVGAKLRAIDEGARPVQGLSQGTGGVSAARPAGILRDPERTLKAYGLRFAELQGQVRTLGDKSSEIDGILRHSR